MHSPRNGTPLVIVKTEARPLVLQPLHQMQPRCTQEHSKTESTRVQKSPSPLAEVWAALHTIVQRIDRGADLLLSSTDFWFAAGILRITLLTYLNFYFSPLTGSDTMIASRMPQNVCISIEETRSSRGSAWSPSLFFE